ncbi:MAG: tetratricopeptide repeat protein [Vicinamibacteria bacterium]
MPAERLDSWKEIAGYLGRSVRTVQRWERQEGLPVHRLQHDKQGSVYALPAELDAWWETRRVGLAAEPADAETDAGAPDGDAPGAETPDGPPRAPEQTPAVARGAVSGRRRLAWIAAGVLAAASAGFLLRGRLADAEPPRLAVLPFANLTGDAEREFLSDGLTDVMIAELGRRRDLGVIARSSVLAYKGAPRAASLVGRELGVDYVLEGSLQEAGEQVRVAVQLVRARDEVSLWAETYDRPRRDLLALESEVASRVADEIHLRLPPPAGTRTDPEAHLTYLRGRFEWNKRTQEGFSQGLAYFQEAVTRDPGYARAWSGLADSYVLMATYGHLSPADATPKAREAARKALALDDALGEAHASLALVHYFADWDFAAAERELRRASQLSPSYANAGLWLGLLYANQGRLPEARAVLRQALDLDPASAALQANVAYCDLFAGRAEPALRQLEELQRRHPARASLEVDRARALLALGRTSEAQGLLERALARGRDAHVLALLGYAYARAGRASDATLLLEELQALARAGPLDLSLLAIVRAGLGRDAEALDALEQAVDARQGSVLTLKVDPELASLRRQPRFQALVARVGL